jgi:Flp pilus assembly protein TadD
VVAALPPGRAGRAIVAGVGAAVVIAAGAWTIERNFHWKNNFTLFTRDVVIAPDSAVLNANASLYYLDEAQKPQNAARREELLNAAIRHLEHALEIHPKFVSARINLGLALFRLGRLDDAEREWQRAKSVRANDPMVENNLRALGQTYFNKGLDEGSEGRYEAALGWFDKALRFDPNNAAIWSNIGKSRYWLKRTDGAREAWTRALQLEPGRRDALSGLAAIGAPPP